ISAIVPGAPVCLSHFAKSICAAQWCLHIPAYSLPALFRPPLSARCLLIIQHRSKQILPDWVYWEIKQNTCLLQSRKSKIDLFVHFLCQSVQLNTHRKKTATDLPELIFFLRKEVAFCAS